ncbi:MAG TPA: phosphate-starvation-inducible PsiE family protein [Streptosporangiaceae bacterium]|nr:phosphate-starvation-inducible PsiE family protein [Streptosporangiaceae bacterium]
MTEPGDQTARPRGLTGTIWVLEHAQDYVAAVVGVALILLAAVLIVAGLAGFARDLATRSVLAAATGLLDRLLLVLIVAEIVHTVVLSLRAHRLVAQPFIVVGLVAVIRKILLVLSDQTTVDATQLWLLIAMVAAFMAGLIAVSRFEKKQE